MFQRLRRYIRQNTLPIKPETAWSWKTKLSIIYAFLGWQIAGITVYMVLKEHTSDKPTASDYAKLLGVTNARVIKISGTEKTDEYELNLKEQDFDEYYKSMKEKTEANRESVKPSTGFWNRRWIDEANAESVLNSK